MMPIFFEHKPSFLYIFAPQDGLLAGLTAALMSKLSPETIVITTDYQLGAGFTLLTSMEGENPGAFVMMSSESIYIMAWARGSSATPRESRERLLLSTLHP